MALLGDRYEAAVYQTDVDALTEGVLDVLRRRTAAVTDERVKSAMCAAALATVAQHLDGNYKMPNIVNPEGVTGMLCACTDVWRQSP